MRPALCEDALRLGRILDKLFASDALLLGRVTCQSFAAAWLSRTDEEGFADRMNSLPEFVASTTLEKVERNNSSLIKEPKRFLIMARMQYRRNDAV
jgi:predicted RNA polymerase sigma factor